MLINVPIMPKRWNPTPNWLDALQHPPASGWYRARLQSDPSKEFEAFCCSTYVWYKADYGTNGHRTQGGRIDPATITYIGDGR